MIFMITRVEVVQGLREKYLQEFHKILPIVLLQKGCMNYDAYIDSEDDRFDNARRSNVVVIAEKWESIEELQLHSRSDAMKEFREKVKEIRVSSKYELLVRKTSV